MLIQKAEERPIKGNAERQPDEFYDCQKHSDLDQIDMAEIAVGIADNERRPIGRRKAYPAGGKMTRSSPTQSGSRWLDFANSMRTGNEVASMEILAGGRENDRRSRPNRGAGPRRILCPREN